MDTSKQIIAYWRDSLIDAELSTLDLTEGNHVRVFASALENGQLDPQTTEALFGQSKQPAPSRREAETEVPVVVAPLVANKVRRGGRQKPLCPLLIPAVLDNNGRLYPKNGISRPWIPRLLLEPTSSDMVIATIQDLDEFYAKNSNVFTDDDSSESWSEFYAHAWKLLNTVTHHQGSQIFEAAGYRISKKAAIISVENLGAMSGNILHIYNELDKSDEIPPFLQRYLALNPPNPQPPLSNLAWQMPAKRHLGNFSPKFPLSATQREALYHLLILSPYDTLAVSGPPGTGKTTLLQSVIASLWVEAALAEERPPIMVVTSTNNQAVTNVIDSFSGNDTIERWLPVPSMGLYLVNTSNKQAEAETQGILTLNKYGHGFPAEAETMVFVERGITHYLIACSQFFEQKIESVNEAVARLHRLLCKTAEVMSEVVDTAFNLYGYDRQLNKIRQSYGDITAYNKELKNQLSQAEQTLQEWQRIRNAWLRYQKDEPITFSVLGFVPGMKRKKEAGYRLFLSEHIPEMVVEPEPKAIARAIDEAVANAQIAVEVAWQAAHDVQQLEQNHQAALTQWQLWGERLHISLDWKALFQLEDEAGVANQFNLFNWLDTHLRYHLFELAAHYWEGRWLQEVVAEKIATPEYKASRNRATQERKWQRYAMLTPCFVTTMHTGPSFFDYYHKGNKPLFNYIDLLIIDEAGQVTPEVSGGMLALARQALVVGDVQQIEPVWSVPVIVDNGNLRRHRLVAQESMIEVLQKRGFMASSGSVMQMAQAVSPYQIKTKQGVKYERGMFLAEHRRCVPEIITYCNTLAYNGRLRPLRPSISEHPWPHLGYIHVKGQMATENGSRKNEREAEALVGWIVANEEAFTTYYNQPLDDILGIVTPFAAQKRTLLRVLKNHGTSLSKVGTVHALQGGERPVVLFSPVYTSRDSSKMYFFDQGPNMLNVAVSRAKDSFIVFGDMDIFDPKLNTPSGILARHLFAREENEIVNMPLPAREEVVDETAIHHIRTLDKHVRTLDRAFERAKQNLVIVSPFLRWRAVFEDMICEKVQAAVSRGVKVQIYIDAEFNENLSLPAAAEAAAALRGSGADVHICHNIHSKVLCVDNDVFVEGSFNWLSAERTLEEFARYETSIIYTGPMAATFIQETVTDIQDRVIDNMLHA